MTGVLTHIADMEWIFLNRNKKTIRLVVAGLLCATAIVIPLFSPFKILLEPASFTLASHVPIFLAMFISPSVAAAVSLGSAAGFFLSGFPIVVVARAASHVVFAVMGAYIIKKYPSILSSVPKITLLAFGASVVHGISEVLVVSPFYLSSNMSGAYYDKGFLYAVVGLVGVGTIIHSMVDFVLAFVIWKALSPAIGSESIKNYSAEK